MPLYCYACTCGKTTRRLCKPAEAKDLPVCECGLNMNRDPRPPTTKIVETLDSGYSPRKVERLADAERLYRERSKK